MTLARASVFSSSAILATCLLLGCNGNAQKLSDLQSKYDLLLSQKAEVDANLRDANAKLKEANSNLSDANSKLSQAQARIAQAERDALLPELHLRLAWTAPDENGFYTSAVVTNDNSENVSVNFVDTRSDGHTSTHKDGIAIGAHGDAYVEMPDNWKFIRGDTLQATVDGHKTGYWSVP